MQFVDGETTEKPCPKCGEMLVMEMSFTDEFSHTTGHYTRDCPILYCPKCEYSENFEGEDYDVD